MSSDEISHEPQNRHELPSTFLTINEVEPSLAFLFAWHIARENYVIARVSFQAGMTHPSCLLAEQSVEMFAKAILHLDHKSQGIHYLPDLLQRGKGKVAYFDKLLNDKRLLSFIKSLSLAYGKMRFGEVGFSLNAHEFCQALDEVAFNLDKAYRETSQPHVVQRARATMINGVTTTSYERHERPLYVPTAMKELFLRNNKYFGEKDISNDFNAAIPLP